MLKKNEYLILSMTDIGCPYPRKLPQEIEFQKKHRSFNTLITKCDSLKEPAICNEIEYNKKLVRSFSIEDNALEKQENIVENVTKQERKCLYTPGKPTTENEKVLVSIACLSRELDYLLHCLNKNRKIYNKINGISEKIDDTTLDDPLCFKQNENEYNFFESLLEDKLMLS